MSLRKLVSMTKPGPAVLMQVLYRVIDNNCALFAYFHNTLLCYNTDQQKNMLKQWLPVYFLYILQYIIVKSVSPQWMLFKKKVVLKLKKMLL